MLGPKCLCQHGSQVGDWVLAFNLLAACISNNVTGTVFKALVGLGLIHVDLSPDTVQRR